MKELEDRDKSRGGEQGVQVIEAEEHGDGVEPGGDEADGDGAHDGDGDHFLRAVDLFRQMGCAVETSKGPVGVDQADDKGDAVRRPSRVVDEVGEDEFGVLVRGGFGGHDDQDDEERDEGGVERGRRDCGEQFAIAVEDECKGVDDLVGDKDVPGEDGAGSGQAGLRCGEAETYKSGCESCQQPTQALPTARATLADVKTAPAQANQPVRYEAKLAYLFGASSLAQKYCPPALGKALASSDSEMPTQVDISAMRMMP